MVNWKTAWFLENCLASILAGQNTQQVPTEMFLHLYHSSMKSFQNHYRWLAALIYKLILKIAALSRLILALLVILELSTRRQKHHILVDRYWRLLVALPRM